MSEEEIGGITECCIDGVVVTAELLSAYLRSWARHGVYFETRHARQPDRLAGDDPVVGARIVYHDVLTYRFSHGHPDRAKRGKLNEEFLHPAAFEGEIFPKDASTDPLYPVVVFPVSRVYPTERLTLQRFLDKLALFLSRLPSGYRYALGVQNSEYLLPAYFDCLREYSVAHTFCASKTMPGLLDQAQLPYALTADVAVVVTEPSVNVECQLGIMEIVRRCVDAKKELYVCLEAVPERQTIPFLAVLMERMSGDLAKLSPIRATKAA